MQQPRDQGTTAGEATTRRRFLSAVAAGGAVLTIGGIAVPLADLWSPAYADATADKGLAQFVESVELAAEQGYAAAAQTGKLTTPTVLQSAELFASHHKAHAAAYGSYAGDATRAVANPKLLASITPLIQGATDETGLVKVLYGLENALAATYLATTGMFTDPIALKAAGSILPVESEHAAVLGHVLGETFDDKGTFVPAFLTTDAAVMPAQYPISPGT
jgi:hypothetical protein